MEYLGIGYLSKMESLKLINYSTNMCERGKGTRLEKGSSLGPHFVLWGEKFELLALVPWPTT
jgi:hypothetical protein